MRTGHILAAAAVCVVGWQLLDSVKRADLGIGLDGGSSNTCVVPAFENFHLEHTEGPNYERVANEFLPYAIASLNAYRRTATFVLSRYDESWTPADAKLIGIEVPQRNGLDLAVFTRERDDAVEILVAFRGTDGMDPADGFAGLSDWAFGNFSWATQWVPWWDQYRAARVSFQRIRDWAKGRFADRRVYYTVTGHSLGGGLAQHVARAFPCVRAVTFNSSCVTNEFRLAEPFESARIVLIHENGDPLASVCSRVFKVRNGEHLQTYGAGNMFADGARSTTSDR